MLDVVGKEHGKNDGSMQHDQAAGGGCWRNGPFRDDAMIRGSATDDKR